MSLNVTPVVEKAFTDEMLAKNFIALAEQSKAIEEWFYLIESRFGEITRQNAQLAKKVSGRKTRFVFGFAVGVAVSPLIYAKLAKALRSIEVVNVPASEWDKQKKQDAAAGQKYTDVVIGEKVHSDSDD